MTLINLISDTVTKPSAEMLAAMCSAEVGDDVFGEDPTVNKLEHKAASMFGMEAALFCPSGTMTNQIAIKCHTQPGDEIICDELSHVYRAEAGGFAFHSGVSIQLVPGKLGKIEATQLPQTLKADFDWLPKSRLLVLENTCNMAGGGFYTYSEITPIRDFCRHHKLGLHLDGARIFNALEETKENPQEIGNLFDSISVCLSKGLGAPVGSLLIGNQQFIKQARRYRKLFGGGMRQAGFLAAAGIFALENNIERLKIDHQNAKQIAARLEKLDIVEHIRPVATNIIIFDVKQPWTANSFLQKLSDQHHLKAAAFGPQTVRFVTHLDFDADMLSQTLEILSNKNWK